MRRPILSEFLSQSGINDASFGLYRAAQATTILPKPSLWGFCRPHNADRSLRNLVLAARRTPVA